MSLVYKFMTDTRETKLFTRAAAHIMGQGQDKQPAHMALLSSMQEQSHGNNHLQWEQLRAEISYQTVSDPPKAMRLSRAVITVKN